MRKNRPSKEAVLASFEGRFFLLYRSTEMSSFLGSQEIQIKNKSERLPKEVRSDLRYMVHF